ncbi:MAG: SURF1 family protein, partial [Stackebrandtia sp.]
VQARSINVDQIADGLQQPVLGAYVTDERPADGFSAIPVVEERSWQNFAYAYQWWLFVAMIPVGLVVIARKEAKTLAETDESSHPQPLEPAT